MKKLIPILILGFLILGSFGAIAINIEKESATNGININEQGNMPDYTHTVLVEAGMRSGCPSCPATNAAWKSIYAGGQYDFEYVSLIYQQNPKAMQRFQSFNPAWVPTSYWDGGQYVHVGTSESTFKSYLDAAGSRFVPDLVGEVSATWLGNAKIDISISVENDDNNDYPGTLRVYVVEIISRWNDYSGKPYGHALLDFPWQQTIDIDSGDTFEDSKVWDAAAVGYGNIDPENIQVILTVCDDTPHTSYSDPPSGNPFNAYYVDEVVATLVELNNPPTIPSVSGPTDVEIGVEYEYTFMATDEENEELHYYIDWGDGFQGWLGPHPSGEEVIVPHTFNEDGIYEVKAKARDELYQESEWSDPLIVDAGNLAPEKPEISGETSGKAGTEYEYTFVANDPNGDNLYYYIKWGDDDIVEWDGPHASGAEVKFSHTWNNMDNYLIEVKVKDTEGAESAWGKLSITMPRNRALNTPFQWLLQQYPNLFPILRYLLGI